MTLLFYEKQNDRSGSALDRSSFSSGMTRPKQSVFDLINSNNKIRITTLVLRKKIIKTVKINYLNNNKNNKHLKLGL